MESSLPAWQASHRPGKWSRTNFLVSDRAVDQVQERCTGEIPAQVLGEQRGALVVIGRQEARHVGRQDHVARGVERWPFGGGSSANTSTAAPAMRRFARASARARSSTVAPRPMLMK